MRDCEYYEELICRSLDDDLNVKEINELAVHLAICPSCKQMRQLMADVSGIMEADLEELPQGLHENIMAGIRRSAVINENKAAGRAGNRFARADSRLGRPIRNILAAAACMAIVLVAALGLNPAERAEGVVLARSNADTIESQMPQESQPVAASQTPEGSPVPEASPAQQEIVAPTPTPVQDEGDSQTDYIITTPAPESDPYLHQERQIQTEPSRTPINPEPSRTPVQQVQPSQTPVETVPPTAETAPQVQTQSPAVQEPVSTPPAQTEPAQNPVAQQPAEADSIQPQEMITGTDELDGGAAAYAQEPAVQPGSTGEVHKAPPMRVFEIFASMGQLSPEIGAAAAAEEGQTANAPAAAAEQEEPENRCLTVDLTEPVELDLMDVEGTDDIMLLIMGLLDENGLPPVEAELPEEGCDAFYVISLVYNDIPCEVSVRLFGDELYFSMAEIIIEPPEDGTQPAPEQSLVQGEAGTEIATGQNAGEGITPPATVDAEEFEPVWLLANCGAGEFEALIECLTK